MKIILLSNTNFGHYRYDQESKKRLNLLKKNIKDELVYYLYNGNITNNGHKFELEIAKNILKGFNFILTPGNLDYSNKLTDSSFKSKNQKWPTRKIFNSSVELITINSINKNKVICRSEIGKNQLKRLDCKLLKVKTDYTIVNLHHPPIGNSILKISDSKNLMECLSGRVDVLIYNADFTKVYIDTDLNREYDIPVIISVGSFTKQEKIPVLDISNEIKVELVD